MTSTRRPTRVIAVAAASVVLAVGATFAGASAAHAWASGVGAAPWLCGSSYFSGSSWHPISTQSRSSTYGAGECFAAYTLSAQLRYSTSGYTIGQKCTTGGGGGAGNCQIVQTSQNGPYTNYKGGRHGMGSVFFTT
jgi:hypothetical protein